MKIKYKQSFLNFFYPFNINKLFGFSKNNHLVFDNQKEIEEFLDYMRDEINNNNSSI